MKKYYELLYIHSADNGRVITHGSFDTLAEARSAMANELRYMTNHRSTKPDKVLKEKTGFVAIFLPKSISAYTITYFIMRSDEKFYGEKLSND